MQWRWYNIVRLAEIPATRQRQPDCLYISCHMLCGTSGEGGAQYCVHSSLCCWQSGASVNLIPYPPTRSQSNGLAHRVGTQGTLFGNWPHCLYICTIPAPLKAAQLPATSGVCPYLPFLFLSPLGSLFPSLLGPPTHYTAGSQAGSGE